VLEEDGRAIAEGALPKLSLAPGDEAAVSIPWGSPVWQHGREYFLTLRFRLREKTSWGEAGHVVAWEQLAVPTPAIVSSRAEDKSAATTKGSLVSGIDPDLQSPDNRVEARAMEVAWRREGDDWLSESDGVRARVDGHSGWLVEYSVRSKNYLVAPLTLNCWRVPIDNDYGWKAPQTMAAWQDAARDAQIVSLLCDGEDSRAAAPTLGATFHLPATNSTARFVYSLTTTGRVRVEVTLNPGPNAPELSRVGVTFAVPQTLSSVRWFGRGPQENYADRFTGAAIGTFASTVEKWITPYVRPQENGHRTDVRWLELTDAHGSGLRASAVGQPLGVNVWPYSAEDLAAAKHDAELPRREFNTVFLDGWQMGVGGDNSWSLPVHDQYRLPANRTYTFRFELELLP
jgi:beta-galactosidase